MRSQKLRLLFTEFLQMATYAHENTPMASEETKKTYLPLYLTSFSHHTAFQVREAGEHGEPPSQQ